jgi:6-phosphogluconolactonase (cycloisomerase 2 family)
MCEHRCSAAWRFPIGFLIGWMLAVGWQGAVQVAVGADADGGFTLYAPSGSRQRLLVVRAKPSQDGVELSMARTVNLGFPGSTIAVHATRPVLYVSGGHGEHRHNAAVVPLDEAGLPQASKPVSLDRAYSSLSTDRAGRFLLGCNYMAGAVDVFPLDADGFPGKRIHGRDEGRKYAHCVLPSPDNRFVYIPYVKEMNALYQYGFDPATGALTPLDPLDVGPPADSGPRHLVYHPRLPLVYFSEEQSLGVSIYRRAEDGRLSLWQRSRAVPADAPGSGLSSSDIVITPDGRHLYAGIRGHEHAYDFIACYSVGDDGSLAARGLVPADKIPWGMVVSPDGRHLAATGAESATLMVYAIAADGSLTRAATLPIDKGITDIVAR